MNKFKLFCITYEKELQFIETLTVIVIVILLSVIYVSKYHLEYKIIFVEKELFTGEYSIIQESVVTGQITDYLSDKQVLTILNTS